MRCVSIDLLRTLAIVLMVVVHFMENLSGADWAPAGAGAPLFTFLVGVSYRLWLNSREAKKCDESETSKISIRRGLFLFVLGFAFNVLVWLPEDTFNWDVLTLIGASLILLCLVRNLPLPVPLMIAALAYVLGPTLRALTDYDSYWTEGYFDVDLTLSDVLLGFLANGFFPLFPWIAYPLVGFVTGTFFFTGERPPTGRAAILGGVFVTLALLGVGIVRLYPDVAVITGRWTMFPPSVMYVTGTLGLALLLFSLGHRWIDPNPNWLARIGIVRVATTFSKHSLTMYLFHHVIHLWPLWIYGAATGTDPTHPWREALPTWATIPLAAACLVLAYGLFRWMDRRGWGGVEGWMRWVCD